MSNKPKAFSVDKPEESSGFLLWQVTTLWQRGIKKALDKISITHPQFVILASLLWLSDKNEMITQIDLSHHSKIDPMTTSTIIKSLLQKKLVERKEHPRDTRAKMVQLTDNGIKVTRMAVRIIEKFDGDFFDRLGVKTKTFNEALVKLLV